MRFFSCTIFFCFLVGAAAQTRPARKAAPAAKPPAAAKAPAQAPAATSGDQKPAWDPKANVKLMVENPMPPPPANISPDAVIVSYGDEKITVREFNQVIDGVPEQYRTLARGTARKQFAENLVMIRLLAKEARRLKMDEDPAYKAQLSYSADAILHNMFQQKMAESIPIDEAALRKYYEEHRGEYESVRARHILIRMSGSPVGLKPGQPDLSEADALAKAQAIRKKLLAGADFAKLAAAESDDQGSRNAGGDLGMIKRGQMVPSFEDVAFSIKPGLISEPVKTPFGFHLIKVEENNSKSFEDVKAELEKRVRPEMVKKRLNEIKAKAGIKLDPLYFPEPTYSPK